MNSDGLSFFLNRPIFLLKYRIDGLKLIINYPLVLFKIDDFCYTTSLMLKKYQKKLRSLFSSNKKRAQTVGKRLLRFVDKKPVSSFLMLLFALVALIALSNIIRKPTIKESQTVKESKTVSVYRIGGAPRIKVQAQIEKSGVVTIASLTSGVVQIINHKEGEHVDRGTQLLTLSTNYQGGNILSLARQAVQTQAKNTEETYSLQKDVIKRQKEVAETMDENSDQLREIGKQSIGETESLISLNDDILSSLDKNLSQYNATNSAGLNDGLILSTKQLKSQYVLANNQLKSLLRSTQYQSGDDNPPADFSNDQKEITIKQLIIQQKAVELGRDIAKLNVQIAIVSEGLMYPVSPFGAVVQKVLVKEGQAVVSGTPLFALSSDIATNQVMAIAYIPASTAKSISLIEPSILKIGNATISEVPSFVSSEAITGTLYGAFFPISAVLGGAVPEKGFIDVEIPIGYFDTSSIVPFVPLDSVYKTDTQAFVFVVQDNKAQSVEVHLGPVVGSYINVESGLDTNSAVILDRTVIAGDPVEISGK